MVSGFIGSGGAFVLTPAMMTLGAPPAFVAITVLSMLAVLVLFSRWLPAYSVQGRKLKDGIDGLRQYLSVAEADDLRRMRAPPQTAESACTATPSTSKRPGPTASRQPLVRRRWRKR